MGLGFKELFVTAAVIVAIFVVFRFIRTVTSWGGAMNRWALDRRRSFGRKRDDKVIDMVRDGDTFVPAKRERRKGRERRR